MSRGLRFRRRIIGVLALLLAGVVPDTPRAAPAVALEPIAGAVIAPEIKLPDLASRTGPLVRRGDAITIVHFWATWCAPCREELPALQALSEAQRDAGVAVLTIASDNAAAVHGYVEQHSLRLPVRIDQYGEALFAYRVLALPTTVVIDRHRHLRYRATGRVDWADATVRELLQRLLAEQ